MSAATASGHTPWCRYMDSRRQTRGNQCLSGTCKDPTPRPGTDHQRRNLPKCRDFRRCRSRPLGHGCTLRPGARRNRTCTGSRRRKTGCSNQERKPHLRTGHRPCIRFHHRKEPTQVSRCTRPRERRHPMCRRSRRRNPRPSPGRSPTRRHLRSCRHCRPRKANLQNHADNRRFPRCMYPACTDFHHGSS